MAKINNLKVDKNVPMPSARNSYGELISKMQVGDSVVVNTMGQAAAIRAIMNKYKYTQAQRKEGDHIRVWRVK